LFLLVLGNEIWLALNTGRMNTKVKTLFNIRIKSLMFVELNAKPQQKSTAKSSAKGALSHRYGHKHPQRAQTEDKQPTTTIRGHVKRWGIVGESL
jgi:hypothetical protein